MAVSEGGNTICDVTKGLSPGFTDRSAVSAGVKGILVNRGFLKLSEIEAKGQTVHPDC